MNERITVLWATTDGSKLGIGNNELELRTIKSSIFLAIITRHSPLKLRISLYCELGEILQGVLFYINCPIIKQTLNFLIDDLVNFTAYDRADDYYKLFPMEKLQPE